MFEKDGIRFIIFSETPVIDIEGFDLKSDFRLKWINPVSVEVTEQPSSGTGGGTKTLKAPFEGTKVAWITDNK